MNNRYNNRSDLQYDDYEPSQAQQWDDRSYGQAGEPVIDYESTEIRGNNRQPRPEGHYDNRSRALTQQRGIDRTRDYRDARAPEGYAPGRYDRMPGRGYGRFTSESYGGRDFVSEARTPYYGYGSEYGLPMGTAGGGTYGGTRYDRYDGSQRPFLERAGDEIASWFGDDDAARRREMDHRGSGPQGYTRSDERILEDVCDHLTEDRYVDARDVTVTVNDREVTLDGTVDSKAAKRRAEDCADHVTGVGHVQNNLRVQDRVYETQPGQQTTPTV